MSKRDQKSTKASSTFSICCAGGKVGLTPLLKPPPYLMYLYTSLADSFHKNIRGYNSLLA
jgi:hypothetical protein